MKKDKPLLVLDLDETLIHATRKPLPHPSDFSIGEYAVYMRPYLQEFLVHAAVYYRLGVWSSASDDYVAAVLSQIIPTWITLEMAWGRSRCTPKYRYQVDAAGYYNTDGYPEVVYTKQFRKIRKLGFSLERSLMVENSPEKIANSYGNAIYVNDYFGDSDADGELLELLEYLKAIADKPNMRAIEKRGWRYSLK